MQFTMCDNARKETYSWYNELSGEQTDSRQCAIGNKWEGSKRVDDGIDIRESLKPL